MATWTPSDLANKSFVTTQLSDKDRSTALYTVNNELASAQKRLADQEIAYAAAQEAFNNRPDRRTINELKAKAADPTLPQAERDAAATQAQALSDQREKIGEVEYQAMIKLQGTKDYVNNLQQGQSNLLQAGAVPPGVNQFAAPPGYDGRSSPATEVPDSQNPNAVPDETTEELQNVSPELIDPTQDPGANFATGEEEVTGYEPLQEPPRTTDGDEFDGIDQQVADNENGLQEPPQLSDEEVNAYLQTAGQETEVQENVFDPSGNEGGNTGALNDTRSTATNQDAVSFEKAKDWRVRLSLAPSAKYLYKADSPGILKPLQATNGVIFPYTPTVSAVYAASYDASELIHSNYKIYNYKNSNVDTVTITGDFTAQDTNEANYLLAVIHFFKSVTKMFYGQDQNPRNGTPPPLVYMSGLGTFQFDNHPLAVTNFTYSLPNEVDYIRAGSMTNEPGSSTANQTPVNNTDNASTARIQSSGLGARTPNFQRQQATINSNATYVPTKMQIVITCIPIVTRNDISNNFSLKNYATGALLQGSKRNGGGMW